MPADSAVVATNEVKSDLKSSRLDGRSIDSPISSHLLDEDWTIEAELRGLERLVGSLKAVGLAGEPATGIHQPHAFANHWHSAVPARTAAETLPESAVGGGDFAKAKSHVVTWLVLSLGLATFACGGVLLGWSLLGQREDLWPVGMPLTLLGQAGLVFGLILQLDNLWNTSRKTAQTLHELDGQLKDVRQTTTLLTTSHAPSGQSFYAHLAQGAAPQLLLADLKGQLDLLSQQMGQRR